MSTYTAKQVGSNYEIYQDGQRISTGSAAVLANYGLSPTNLGGSSTPVSSSTPVVSPVASAVYSPATVSQPTTQTYVVKSGDNLSKIAQQYGVNVSDITGYRSGNPNLIYAGETLTIKKGSTTPSNATDVTNMSDANAYINNNQQQDFNNASKTTDPQVRSSVQSYADLYDSISKSLTQNLPEKPATVDLSKTYTDLRSQYGVTDLENQLNDLNSQAQALQAASAARTQAEKDKPVAMNVISGRISEEEAQDNARLAQINNSIKTVTAQLQTKYNVIDNIMKYTGTDYNNAVDAYNTQFTQNLNLMNTVKGVVDSQKSDIETAADDARANLQIIYNNISSGAVSLDSIDPVQQANITKLELQAGLPSGFYSTLISKNPKATILSTTTRESNGQKYADVIMKNNDGSLSTKSISLGAVTSSDNTSLTQQLQDARALVAPQLQARRGSDGYVSPEDYTAAKDKWIATGLSGDDFDKSFKQYANPESYAKLGLSF